MKAIFLSDIDAVLNNAGYTLIGAMNALSDEKIVQDINTKLLGTRVIQF